MIVISLASEATAEKTPAKRLFFKPDIGNKSDIVNLFKPVCKDNDSMHGVPAPHASKEHASIIHSGPHYVLFIAEDLMQIQSTKPALADIDSPSRPFGPSTNTVTAKHIDV